MRLLQAARLSRLADAATGLDKQDGAAQRYADAYDHEIVAVVADTDVSGSTRPHDRPKLGPWLTDPAKMRQYDGIVAAHLDRLGRNVRHLADLHKWAEDNGKVLITVEPNIDWSSDVGKLIWGIMSWLAEQELKAITRRNADTQKWLKDNGYLVGKPPFGFLVVDVPGSGLKKDHKTLAPDPALSPVIKGMVDRALNGDSITSICAWLDSEGIPPVHGGIWSPKSVGQILRNPVLIGRRQDAKGRTVLRFKPIIDLGTFNSLQTKLDSNPRRRGATSNDPAMLTGVIFCDKCKRVMHRRRSVTRRKDGSAYIYEAYRCDGTPREPSTCRNMVPLADVHSVVNGYFVAVQYETVEAVTIPGNGCQDELEQNARDIAELDIDAEDYDARLKELRAERKRLQSLPNEPDKVEYEFTGETVAERWARQTTDAERRAFLLDAGVKVYATREAQRVEVSEASALWWKA